MAWLPKPSGSRWGLRGIPGAGPGAGSPVSRSRGAARSAPRAEAAAEGGKALRRSRESGGVAAAGAGRGQLHAGARLPACGGAAPAEASRSGSGKAGSAWVRPAAPGRCAPPSHPEPRRLPGPARAPDKRPGLGWARAGSGSCLAFRFHCSGSPSQPWWGTTPAVILRWFRAVILRTILICWGKRPWQRGEMRLQRRQLRAGSAARPRGGTAGPSAGGSSGKGKNRHVRSKPWLKQAVAMRLDSG